MDISKRAAWLAGISLSLMGTSALAQEASGPVNTENAGASDGNDIIVTARRREETLQDVPQTINAVSSETIQKLRINNAADIAQIVPGLTIEGSSSGSGGFGSSSGIRGVPTFLNSNASPVVQFYLNDAVTGRGPEVTQALFDIGQIEVLKGPQGTLRGRSAPTGAITITTKRPDLDEVGGFVNLSSTLRGNMNFQAAINVPIVSDVLALRVAGAVDHNDGSGVTSANNRIDPYSKSEAVRATLRFQPSPDFDATVMYQRLWRTSRSFSQVFGPGNGVNGPIIQPEDRLGITDAPTQINGATDFIVGQVEWRFAGQKLNYVGSYRNSKLSTRSPQDNANIVRGVDYFQQSDSGATEGSHEIRLSSDERILGMFDYTVGLFYDRETSHPRVNGVARILSGAFGAPGTAPAAITPVERYVLRNLITIDPQATEKSVFASLTAHIGDKTEISAGGRYINFQRKDRYTLGLAGGFNAVAAPNCPFVPGAIPSPVYPGACEVAIPSQLLQSADRTTTFTPFLYNISASHKFTPDFMVYANVGTAFRSAGPAIGVQGVTSCCTQAGGANLGSIDDLIFHGQERSTTYEIGFKSSFFDRRARLNVSLFKQNFKNFFFLTQSTNYLNVTDPANPLGGQVSQAEFTADVDAKVRGIDVEAAFQVTPRWNVNVGFTYSKARLDNALVPCNDSNFNGVVDGGTPTVAGFVGAGTLIARCRSSESISRTPNWNLTLQSEYSAPINSGAEGFIRGNWVYYPDNPNATQKAVISNYSLLNLYAGIRSPDNAWEVSLFANNLLNAQQILSITPTAPTSSGSPGNFFPQGAVGYQSIAYTPRREFGLNVRYAFGSR